MYQLSSWSLNRDRQPDNLINDGQLRSRIVITKIGEHTRRYQAEKDYLSIVEQPLTATNSRLVALTTDGGRLYDLHRRQLLDNNMKFTQVVDIDIPYRVAILTLNEREELGRLWTDSEDNSEYKVLYHGVKLIVPGLKGSGFFLTNQGEWKCYRKGLLNDPGAVHSISGGPVYEDVKEVRTNSIITKDGVFMIKMTLIPCPNHELPDQVLITMTYVPDIIDCIGENHIITADNELYTRTESNCLKHKQIQVNGSNYYQRLPDHNWMKFIEFGLDCRGVIDSDGRMFMYGDYRRLTELLI